MLLHYLGKLEIHSDFQDGGRISPAWGEAPTEPICTEICAVVAVPDVIMCAKR